MTYVIWWLSQEDCEQMDNPGLLGDLPDYIKEQWRSRLGRPGRGRLWIPSDISIESIAWNDLAPLAKATDRCGGIVIRESDAVLVAPLPGFLTGLYLERFYF